LLFLGKLLSNLIERPKIRKPNLPYQGRGVKILPAGCGKLISQFLLGSNVRVRAVRERTQLFRKPLPRTNVVPTNNANDHLRAEKTNDEGHMQEVADGNEYEDNLMVEEEVLSDSDDDIRSASPMSSVQESRADSDDVVISSDDEVSVRDDQPESVISVDQTPRSDAPIQSANTNKSIEVR
jgi:hypothetical protein